MPEDSQQPIDPAALENNPWQEKAWQDKINYAKNVMALQQSQADEDKSLAEEKKARAEEEAANDEETGPEDAQWARRIAIAKNQARGGTPNPNEEQSPAQISRLLKKIAPIDKKIKEEMKKEGNEYYFTYFFLLIIGGTFDAVGVICDLVGVAFWANLILSPIYFVVHYIGIKWANIGIADEEFEKNMLRLTIISGAIAATGIPTRIATMIREFSTRKLIQIEAAQEIAKLNGQRKKILGPILARQFPPPNQK